MKKTITIFVLFYFCLALASLAQPAKWSSWSQIPNTLFQVSTVNYGYNKDIPGYLWGVRIKNGYPNAVSLSYQFSVGGEKYPKSTTNKLSPGQIWTDGESRATSLLFKNNSDSYYISVENVCFTAPNYDCYRDGYAEYVGGRLSIPQKKNSNQLEMNTNQTIANNQAMQANQKWEQEVTDKTKTYFEYYEKATQSQQVGNYDAAISNWKSAIAVAVNSEQRNNAQQWLELNIEAKQKATNADQNSSSRMPQQLNILNQQILTPSAADIKTANLAYTAAAAAELGMAIGGIVEASRNLKNAERELYNSIMSDQQNHTEALDYFNKYLKYKKRSKRLMLTGLGSAAAGLGLVLSTYSLEVMNVGSGMLIGGGVLYIASLPPFIKSTVNYGKASNLLGFNSNIEIKPFFASNQMGNRVGVNINF